MNTVIDTLTILPLTAFNDNYIWVLRRNEHVVIVDPGDAQPVLDYLAQTQSQLAAILITHHHGDHVGGLASLLRTASVPVFGPHNPAIAGISKTCQDGDRVVLAALGIELSVIAVPGHTLDHLAFHAPSLEALFCGDTLFAGGCGRLFEGTAAQMHGSLACLAALPPATKIYCAHEYTQANLRFAQAVEPDNHDIAHRAEHVAILRAAGQVTVPSPLATELATNPFLRWDAPAVRAAAETQLGRAPIDAVETFAAIRGWKDSFRG